MLDFESIDVFSDTGLLCAFTKRPRRATLNKQPFLSKLLLSTS